MALSTQSAWDKQPYLYGRWSGDNDYRHFSGQIVMPKAEDPPTSNSELATWSPVSVVQIHAPYQTRTMSFATKKRGSPPVLPEPANSGAFVFLGGDLNFKGPTNDISLTKFDWEVSGTYAYVQNCRSAASDGYVLTGFPFPLSSQYANLVYSGGGQGPTVGPVASAGADVLTGYTLAQQIDFATPYWSYSTPTYFPGKMFNPDLSIGGLPPPQ